MEESVKQIKRIIDDQSAGRTLRRLLYSPSGRISKRKDWRYGRAVNMARYELRHYPYCWMTKDEKREFLISHREWIEVCAGWLGGWKFVLELRKAGGASPEVLGMATMVALERHRIPKRKIRYDPSTTDYVSMFADDDASFTVVKHPEAELLFDPESCGDKTLIGYDELDVKSAFEIIMELDLRGVGVTKGVIEYIMEFGRTDVLRAIDTRYGKNVLTNDVVAMMAESVLYSGFSDKDIESRLSLFNYFEERIPGIIERVILKENLRQVW